MSETIKLVQISDEVGRAVVADVQILIDQATAGNVSGYAIVFTDKDGDTNVCSTFTDRLRFMGALAVMQHETWDK